MKYLEFQLGNCLFRIINSVSDVVSKREDILIFSADAECLVIVSVSIIYVIRRVSVVKVDAGNSCANICEV